MRICRIRLSEKTHAIAVAIACDAACDSWKQLGSYQAHRQSPSRRRFLRPPSTGAPSLHRRYPVSSVLRAPPPSQSARPFSHELLRTAITAGTSRVVYGPLRRHAVASYLGRMDGICSLVPFHRLRPSPKPRRVGSCINVFEACSAFTHVMACLLTESLKRPSAPELQQSRCLHRCSDCYRVERTSSRAGLTPAVDHHLFTAHAVRAFISTEWFVGSLFVIIFEWPTIVVQKSGGIQKLSVSVTLCG